MTSVSRTISTPRACAPLANPIVTPLGSATPSAAQYAAPRMPATSMPGEMRAASSGDSHCTSTPMLRWSAMFFSNAATLAAFETRKR